MTNSHPKKTSDFAHPQGNGVAGEVAKENRRTKEYKARVAAERHVLRSGDTKTIWGKYLRYLYAELLKAYFGHKYDPDYASGLATYF